MPLSSVNRVGPTETSRSLKAGPMVGFYEFLSASGSSLDNAVDHLAMYAGEGSRIVALGWYCRDPGTNTAILFKSDDTPETATGGSNLHSSVDLDVNPSGIIRSSGTTPVLTAANRVLGSTLVWINVFPTVTAGPILDITVWALLWHTSFMHAASTND